ncbi:MAG TPA: hypothetical protein VJT71_14910 [Pyrinomonadaceae bacterium]|nr:hypothetical protein [Pyrinomonadaceae bacterium]
MCAQSQRVVVDPDQSKVRPIEFLTENGFSIFRRWEIEGTPAHVEGGYEFLVRDTAGKESVTFVEIADDLFTQIEILTCRRILRTNSFWTSCTERHLASYLAQSNAGPPNGTLRVETLTPDDLNLSIRWERT